MPSHFHSPAYALGSSGARSASSSACASMTGRNGAGSRPTGFSPKPSTQANSSAYGGLSPGQISSIASGSSSPSAATAVLASRAETPMRRPPVTSFNSAQRPVSSSASSQRANCPGSSVLPSMASFATTSDSMGGSLDAPAAGGRGHSRATVSDRSPTY